METGCHPSFAGRSHVGGRVHNEDAFVVDAQLGLAVVADGVGGHQAGEIASELVCNTIISQVRAGSDLTAAVEAANVALLAAVHAGQGRPGMATTIVAARYLDGEVEIAWVGDSRAYLWDGQLQLLTEDHSYVQSLLSAGRITWEEARSHPRRNIISQALGLELEAGLRVGHNRCQLPVGATLLLCSDGLSDVVEAPDLCAIVGSGEPLACRCEQLVTVAVSAGGQDNITVVLIDGAVAVEPAAPPERVVWRYQPSLPAAVREPPEQPIPEENGIDTRLPVATGGVRKWAIAATGALLVVLMYCAPPGTWMG